MTPFRPPVRPRATNALILICVAVQLASLLAGDAIVLGAGMIPARLTTDLAVPFLALPAPLTLASSLFVHAGWMHLLFNMLFLAFVGRGVEWVLGPQRLLLLFLAGGMAGNVAQLAAEPLSITPVIGASGGVAAVFGAYALLFSRRRPAPAAVGGLSVPSGLLNALWMAAVWIGLQLATALAFNGNGGGIAIWAHIGGFVAGMLLLTLLRALRLAR